MQLSLIVCLQLALFAISSVSCFDINSNDYISYKTEETESREVYYQSKGNPSVLTRCSKKGVIAITFDDGPHYNTFGILDVLKEKKVPATFFVNGINWGSIYTETSQEAIRRAINEGHEIGSHTWAHPNNLEYASHDEVVSQMTLLSDALISLNLTSKKPRFMRPPYGAYNDKVVEIIHGELGYIMINWSIDTLDYSHPGDTEKGVENYANELRNTEADKTEGFIALHHDVHTGGDLLAAASIDYGRKMGYEFVTLQECLGL